MYVCCIYLLSHAIKVCVHPMYLIAIVFMLFVYLLKLIRVRTKASLFSIPTGLVLGFCLKFLATSTVEDCMEVIVNHNELTES